MAKAKNEIKMSGWIGFPRKVGDKLSVAQLSLPVNTGTKEEPKWKYLNIQVKSTGHDFEAFNKKRVQVSGWLSGDAYIPKGSTKEVVSPVIWVKEIKELGEGEKGENTVELTSYVKFVETYGEKGIRGQASVRFDDKDGIKKYLNVQLNGNREKTPIEDDKRYDITGFIKGDFFTPKGMDREIGKMVVVMTAVEENPWEDGATPPPPPGMEGETAGAESAGGEPDNVPEIDINEDEIPF